MAITLYSYEACLGAVVLDWANRKVTLRGMDGEGTAEMTPEEVLALFAEHRDNPDVKVWALIFWPENEQLCAHDESGFRGELEHDREVNEEDDDDDEEKMRVLDRFPTVDELIADGVRVVTVPSDTPDVPLKLWRFPTEAECWAAIRVLSMMCRESDYLYATCSIPLHVTHDNHWEVWLAAQPLQD